MNFPVLPPNAIISIGIEKSKNCISTTPPFFEFCKQMFKGPFSKSTLYWYVGPHSKTETGVERNLDIEGKRNHVV